jgi:hypothetical protein
MTRDEIKTLGIGSKLQLIDGQIGAVQSIDLNNEWVTFQYEAKTTTTGSDAYSALGGWMGPKIISADGAIDLNPPPVPPPVALAADLTTTVRCKWVELVNALKL